MNLAEYTQYDGLALAELVRRREVSRRELADLFLTAVVKVNPQINAVLEVYPQRCEGLEDEFDLGDRPFEGVPFLLKDIGASEKGMRQEAGSRLLRGYVAQQDTFLTERFRAAGLILLGRSAAPEFALSSSTESLLNGPTRNPWNLEVLAGGSSGGAAASVAAGILPVAHASDGAGSIRIPASACGVVGLKTSRGRVSLGPLVAEQLGGMAVEFAISRTVRDTAALLDAVSQPGVGDPYIIVQPERPFLQEVGAPLGELRVALCTTPWGPFTTDMEVAEATRRIADECEAMHLHVEETSPQYDYEEFLRAQCIVWAVGFDVMLETLAAEVKRPLNEETLEAVTLSMYHFAKGLKAADLVWADDVLNRIRRKVGQFFQDYDLLLTPTLNRLPEPLGRYSQNVTDVDYIGFFRRCDEMNFFCPLFNLTGQPAISLPLAWSRSGLPIGIQFAAHFGEEATLIRLASEFEQRMPWRDRIPPVHVSREQALW